MPVGAPLEQVDRRRAVELELLGLDGRPRASRRGARTGTASSKVVAAALREAPARGRRPRRTGSAAGRRSTPASAACRTSPRNGHRQHRLVVVVADRRRAASAPSNCGASPARPAHPRARRRTRRPAARAAAARRRACPPMKKRSRVERSWLKACPAGSSSRTRTPLRGRSASGSVDSGRSAALRKYRPRRRAAASASRPARCGIAARPRQRASPGRAARCRAARGAVDQVRVVAGHRAAPPASTASAPAGSGRSAPAGAAPSCGNSASCLAAPAPRGRRSLRAGARRTDRRPPCLPCRGAPAIFGNSRANSRAHLAQVAQLLVVVAKQARIHRAGGSSAGPRQARRSRTRRARSRRSTSALQQQLQRHRLVPHVAADDEPQAVVLDVEPASSSTSTASVCGSMRGSNVAGSPALMARSRLRELHRRRCVTARKRRHAEVQHRVARQRRCLHSATLLVRGEPASGSGGSH